MQPEPKLLAAKWLNYGWLLRPMDDMPELPATTERVRAQQAAEFLIRHGFLTPTEAAVTRTRVERRSNESEVPAWKKTSSRQRLVAFFNFLAERRLIASDRHQRVNKRIEKWLKRALQLRTQ